MGIDHAGLAVRVRRGILMLVIAAPLNLYGFIPHSFLRRKRSPIRSPSFPHALSGNPGESGSGPPIKTFGGDRLAFDTRSFLRVVHDSIGLWHGRIRPHSA